MNFVGKMNADTVTAMPDTHRAIIEGRPAWATGAFGFAVFGGALGCLLLLLRKSAASYLFIASLLGVIVQMLAYLLGSTIEFGPVEIIMMILLPLVVAAFLIWYSKRAEHKGWIG